MKICHIVSAFKRDDTRIFRKQCRTLVEYGYDVTLIVNDGKNSEVKDGVKIESTGFKYKNKLHRILFSKNINFKKALEIDADIFQIHDPEFIPLGLKLLKRGKLIIYDSHEDFPRQILEKDWIPKIFRKILSVIAEMYINKALKKYHAILSVTPHIVDTLKKATENVYLVTNYPSINVESKSFSFDEYNSRTNKMCYAGTVYRSSLQENVIKAIHDQTKIEYIIVGTIEGEYKSELSDLIEIKNVQLVDQVPMEKVLRIYKETTIGIAIFDYSPNLGYKVGSMGVNKIFEYMYSGLPIICTDFELWKEIIDKYNCGIYVNPHSVDEIKNALNYMIENKKDAFQMGQNGRKAVLEEYNWKTQEKTYIKAINKVLSNKS